ncbi:hypothetical protein P154DRAFT_441753 [Amniculicola lignicola CBS 123094]|uniref:Sld7 C-terminal domain-containing protein n=1 Tax=Amniculicola lignicola CBS 123094 TaxID=1392246 RepID=A0A6A5W5V4_9PLEO|nr:hypothetical protein P154DRAFT_441753 [Amniculicola lignicola CBS 123094]
MADIWSGHIVLPDRTVIQDIVLASQKGASSSLPAGTLRFLSTVDVARIPLYLATGPSLDVWTSCQDTESWFESILLSEPATPPDSGDDISCDWWTCARSQGPIGILVQFESENEEAISSPRVTEMLFYGTIVTVPRGSLPTPPSSSPETVLARHEDLTEFRVHALTLSSDLIRQPNDPELLPESPSCGPTRATDRHAQFLPAQFHSEGVTPSSAKRKRNVFDEATQLRRKARRKEGEGVSAAAAKAGDLKPAYTHRKTLSIDTEAATLLDSRPASAHDVLSRSLSRPVSRSPSMSSDIRPLSRKGPSDVHAKRSALSRVSTVPIHSEEASTETRNKEALSRVVMAAMRMYGLQQRKRPKSRHGSLAAGAQVDESTSEEAAIEEATKDEEYKLIYHQTYKGAALALRRYIISKPLHVQPDRMRDVVERLLAIFCTDPLVETMSVDQHPRSLTTPQKGVGIVSVANSHESPFDAPSGGRATVVREINVHQLQTGSPAVKKRFGENTVDMM